MRLLLDTNLFLEVILEQDAAAQARATIENNAGHELFVSDYSIHSIGILLFRRGQHSVFEQFINDLFAAGIQLVDLDLPDLSLLIDIARQFRLDFDDAYQYTTAERYDLAIVSFDHDFDRTQRGRRRPGEV